MEQGQALDRPEMDARPGDVGEPRRQDQLRRGALEVPAQLTDRLTAASELAGDDHGVRLMLGRRGGAVAHAADHGDARALHDEVAAVVVVDGRPHEAVLGPGMS